jgi:hypothetical protein
MNRRKTTVEIIPKPDPTQTGEVHMDKIEHLRDAWGCDVDSKAFVDELRGRRQHKSELHMQDVVK